MPSESEERVRVFAEISATDVRALLATYGMELVLVDENAQIPGSYWGDAEAGLLGNQLYVRLDTPVHSILHEACHFICMDQNRRDELERDAGGDYAEENAVCYLQIILAEHIPDFSRERMLRDMDLWGYTFRLGSAQAWFEQDAADARVWLEQHGILTGHQIPTGRRRDR
ncbi:MAG: hypothetical protein ACJ8OJ_05750 [Povalibacter sp.]